MKESGGTDAPPQDEANPQVNDSGDTDAPAQEVVPQVDELGNSDAPQQEEVDPSVKESAGTDAPPHDETNPQAKGSRYIFAPPKGIAATQVKEPTQMEVLKEPDQPLRGDAHSPGRHILLVRSIPSGELKRVQPRAAALYCKRPHGLIDVPQKDDSPPKLERTHLLPPRVLSPWAAATRSLDFCPISPDFRGFSKDEMERSEERFLKFAAHFKPACCLRKRQFP